MTPDKLGQRISLDVAAPKPGEAPNAEILVDKTMQRAMKDFKTNLANASEKYQNIIANESVKNVFFVLGTICPAALILNRVSAMIVNSSWNALRETKNQDSTPQASSSPSSNTSIVEKLPNNDVTQTVKKDLSTRETPILPSQSKVESGAVPTSTYIPIPTPPRNYNKDIPRTRDKKEVETKSQRLIDEYLQTKDGSQQESVETKFKMLAASNRMYPEIKKSVEKDQKLAVGIMSTFEKKDIKEGLSATMDHLLAKHGVNSEDIKREAVLIGKDEASAKRKMVERLLTYKQGNLENVSPSLAKRQEVTGFELSSIKAIEKAYKLYVSDNEQQVATLKMDNKDVTVIFSEKGGSFLEERFLAEGSYKTATLASDYFKIQTPEDRFKYVILKPKPKPASVNVSEIKGSATQNVGTITSEPEESGTVQYNSVQYNSVQYNSVQYNSVQYNSVQYNSVQFNPTSGSTSTKTGYSGIILNQPKEPELHEMSTYSIEKRLENFKKERDEGNYTLDEKIKEVEVYYHDRLEKTQTKDLTSNQMKHKLELLKSKSQSPEYKTPDKQEKILNDLTTIEQHIIKREKDKQLLKEFDENPTDEREDYHREIDLSLELQSEYIVKVHAVTELKNGDKVMIQEAAGFSLETTEGDKKTEIDLQNIYKDFKKGRLKREDQERVLSVMTDAFKGVQWMHENGYIHRDLKEQNILITKEGKGVLTDFGTVVKIEGDPNKITAIGTAHYMAPEVILNGENELWNNTTERCDVWSCGMILQEILKPGGTKVHPAIDKAYNDIVIIEKYRGMREPINVKEYEDSYPKPIIPIGQSDSIEHLIWSATRFNPEERPSMEEFNGRWTKLMTEQLDGLLKSKFIS